MGVKLYVNTFDGEHFVQWHTRIMAYIELKDCAEIFKNLLRTAESYIAKKKLA